MEFNPDRIRFKGKLFSAAHKFGGSVESKEAQAFVLSLYAEWLSTGRPLGECERWLEDRLKGCFQSLNEAPVWVEDEPDWPFHTDQPMVFISQTSIGDHEPAASKLAPGETVYLFGARSPGKEGFRMFYKVVSQFAEFRREED